MSPPQIIVKLDPDLASTWPTSLSYDNVSKLLIKSIYLGELADTCRAFLKLSPENLSNSSREFVQLALNTCKRISESERAKRKSMNDNFCEAGIDATIIRDESDSNSSQFDGFAITLSRSYIRKALTIAKSQGFTNGSPWKRGAWESHIRNAKSIKLVRIEDPTSRMELRIKESKRSNWLSKLQPSQADYELVTLPRPFWILYYLVKPMRLLKTQLLGKTAHRESWPFLRTPKKLLPGLFQFANISSSDMLIDLGCGDGRIVIEAGKQIGCRALGIELDKSLATQATKNVANESLEKLVTIIQGDAKHVSLPAEPCVIFLFLPIRNVPSIIEWLRARLASGSRIITHEQEELLTYYPPDSSKIILSKTAITVAHLWRF